LEEYKTIPTEDLSLRCYGNDGSISQLASGGGVGRSNKEIIRRAMCFLILEEAFKRGRNINLITS
jgi:hypothetical protein